jgi:hypothetical protein
LKPISVEGESGEKNVFEIFVFCSEAFHCALACRSAAESLISDPKI